MATAAELLAACKAGLNIQASETAFDDVLGQKITLIQGFLTGAGVSADVLGSDLAVPVIVLGVGDTWNLDAGELKFSPVFLMLVSQLAAKGSKLNFTSTPLDGATNVPISVAPSLTFSQRLASHNLRIRRYTDQADVPTDVMLDITEKVLTATPRASLTAATKYALVVEAASVDGPGLARTVLAFTTAGS
jgi:hypothetical protein